MRGRIARQYVPQAVDVLHQRLAGIGHVVAVRGALHVEVRVHEAGEVEAMEAAYTELQQRLDYTQKSRDMFMGSAKAWRATAERDAGACAHWQSVALERKTERDGARQFLLRGDQALAYGRIVQTMGTLNDAGYARIALVSEAPPR